VDWCLDSNGQPLGRMNNMGKERQNAKLNLPDRVIQIASGFEHTFTLVFLSENHSLFVCDQIMRTTWLGAEDQFD